MKIIYDDIFNIHKQGGVIGITTNSCLDRNGYLVMGKGIALQAKKLFPELPRDWGKIMTLLSPTTNYTFYDETHRMFAIQTKNHWRRPSNTCLISASLDIVISTAEQLQLSEVYIPPLGCGNGGLNWDTQIKPLIENKHSSNIIVVLSKTFTEMK